MIEILLKQLDFNSKEIAIYLGILKAGKILPAELAKKTGINRTTTYSIAKKLLKKGVIAEDLGTTPHYLIALPPADLENLVKKEEKELELKKAKVNTAIQELQKLTIGTEYTLPKIVFIEEADLEVYLYKRTPDWAESILKYDGIWWGFQDHTFVEHYEKWIDWTWKTVPKEMTLRLLSNESEIETKMGGKGYQRRQIRFWKHAHFTGNIWINGDHLVLIVTAEHPFYLVEITDKRLAENFRLLFQGIWKDLD